MAKYLDLGDNVKEIEIGKDPFSKDFHLNGEFTFPEGSFENPEKFGDAFLNAEKLDTSKPDIGDDDMSL